MPQRVGARSLREATRPLWRLPEPGVSADVRPGDPRSPPGSSRDRLLSPARRRDVLVCRCRLRRGRMGCRCFGLRRHVRRAGSSDCRRTVAVRQRGPCLALLLRARPRLRSPANGLVPDHRDDVPPARAEHGVVRPALPEPGHDAPGWIRQPDRPSAPAPSPNSGKHGLSGREPRAPPGPVGLPPRGQADEPGRRGDDCLGGREEGAGRGSPDNRGRGR